MSKIFQKEQKTENFNLLLFEIVSFKNNRRKKIYFSCVKMKIFGFEVPTEQINECHMSKFVNVQREN